MWTKGSKDFGGKDLVKLFEKCEDEINNEEQNRLCEEEQKGILAREFLKEFLIPKFGKMLDEKSEKNPELDCRSVLSSGELKILIHADKEAASYETSNGEEGKVPCDDEDYKGLSCGYNGVMDFARKIAGSYDIGGHRIIGTKTPELLFDTYGFKVVKSEEKHKRDRR